METIDTAPKDGTVIIGWSKRHGFSIGALVDHKKPEMPLPQGDRWFQPTHWAELPREPFNKPRPERVKFGSPSEYGIIL